VYDSDVRYEQAGKSSRGSSLSILQACQSRLGCSTRYHAGRFYSIGAALGLRLCSRPHEFIQDVEMASSISLKDVEP
jgi:hypothetical protein